MDNRAWVDLVVPVHNEAVVLVDSVARLHAYLSEHFPFDWRIVIADNASTDGTRAVAHRLVEELAGVEVARDRRKGTRAGAPRGVDGLERRHRRLHRRRSLDGIDWATAARRAARLGPLGRGRRFSPQSPDRGRTRTEARAHLADPTTCMLRLVFAVRFRDAQCGFKAMRTDIAKRLVPAVRDEEWFFDTELLLLAEHNGLRVHEVPVDWVDDPDSRVDVPSTAMTDLRGVCRVLWTFMRGGGTRRARHGRTQAARRRLRPAGGVLRVDRDRHRRRFARRSSSPFAMLSVRSGPTSSPSPRRPWATTGRTGDGRSSGGGPQGRWWHVTTSTVIFLVTVTVCSIGLAIVGDDPTAQVVVLLVTWGIAGIVRFVVMRSWVYGRAAAAHA